MAGGVKIRGFSHFQFVACDWPRATRKYSNLQRLAENQKYMCIKVDREKNNNQDNKQNKAMRNIRMFGIFSYREWLRPPTKTREGFCDAFK